MLLDEYEETELERYENTTQLVRVVEDKAGITIDDEEHDLTIGEAVAIPHKISAAYDHLSLYTIYSW